MNDDPDLRRSKIALRLQCLQESGVTLPADLAAVARKWAQEERERAREAATKVVLPSEEQVDSSDDAVEVAKLLTADRPSRPDARFVFSGGDRVTGWLEQHPDQASALFKPRWRERRARGGAS